MNKFFKRVVSAVAAVAVVVTAAVVFDVPKKLAAAEKVTGDGYIFDSDTGKLTITSNAGSTNWITDVEPRYGYSAVLSVEIADGVTYIGNHAFNNCDRLTSITIPNGVTSIGDNTFASCPSLGEIIYPSGATVSSGAIPDTATQVKYTANNSTLNVTEITLGKVKTSFTVTDDMNINFVAENQRSMVSQTGHTHVFANDVCQICNTSAPSIHTHKACGDSAHEGCNHGDIVYEPFPTTLDDFELDINNIIIGDDKNYYLTDDLTDETFSDTEIYIKDATVNFALTDTRSIQKALRFPVTGY